MEVNLRCSACGESSLVSIELLCEVWKRGYESLGEKQKRQAKVKADVQCHCGNKDVYDSPMLDYMFQTIFQELVLGIH